jgi:hypothetical protein
MVSIGHYSERANLKRRVPTPPEGSRNVTSISPYLHRGAEELASETTPALSMLSEDTKRHINTLKDSQSICIFEAEQQETDDYFFVKVASPENIILSKGAWPCIAICGALILEGEPRILVLHSADLMNNREDDKYNETLNYLKRHGELPISHTKTHQASQAEEDFNTYISSIEAMLKETLESLVEEGEDLPEVTTYYLIGSTEDTRGILSAFKRVFKVDPQNIIENKDHADEGLSLVVLGGEHIIVGTNAEIASLNIELRS